MKKSNFLLVLTLLALVGVYFYELMPMKYIDSWASIRGEDTKAIMEKMSLEEKIEQMLIIDIPYIFEGGKQVDYTETTKSVQEFFKTRKPGGVILFENNMVSEEQTKKMIEGIQSSSDKVTFFISVDEEGGRISKIPVKLNIPTAKEIGDTGNPKNAFNAGKKIGNELKILGFNLDYAPDMDVNTNPNNPIIGDRSFSSNPKVVSEFGVEFIKGLREEGILSTAKHFPGHGDTTGDSHKGFVEVTHDIERIRSVELLPFREAIKASVDFIMVGHISVPALDKTGTPASLSKPIVWDLLKGEMGFKGVVITDALDMGAITEKYNKFESVKMAINCGNDIALMPDINVVPGKDVSEYDGLVKFLVDEVKKGNIKEERINEGVARILDAKGRMK